MGIRRVVYDKKIHYELIVEDEVFTESDLLTMSTEQLHTLCGFLETKAEISFVKNGCKNEIIEIYLNNLENKLN